MKIFQGNTLPLGNKFKTNEQTKPPAICAFVSWLTRTVSQAPTAALVLNTADKGKGTLAANGTQADYLQRGQWCFLSLLAEKLAERQHLF